MRVKMMSLVLGCLAWLGAGLAFAQDPTVNVTITYVSTGKTYQVATADPGEYLYTDRARTYGYRFLPDRTTPAPDPTVALETTAPVLFGQTFIRPSNDDKNQTVARYLEFTIDKNCTIYIAHDKRGLPTAQGGTGGNPADWLEDGTWTLTPYTVCWYVDNETPSQDGSSPMPVFSKVFQAGTVTLGGPRFGTYASVDTNYLTFIVPTSFNPPPFVDAGANVILPKPVLPQVVQLDGTVTDEDPVEPAPGEGPWEIAMEWSLVSGPAAVEFSDATIEDPTVTITTPGTYVLQLYGTDGEKEGTDTVTIYVNDPSKNQLMAHWDFEAMQAVKGATVLDVANANDGVWVTDGPDPNALPNIIPGWITGSTQALELNSPAPSHINVTISDTEPNFVDGPRFAMTISSWIKVDEFSRSWSNVVSKGDDSWRIARLSRSEQNNNAVIAQFSGTTPGTGYPDNGPNTSISVNDNFWHHACGTYDGEMIRLYVDGVLDVEAPYTGFINTSTYPIQIGGNAQQAGRMWDGALDDVRLYNYALDAGDIRLLTAQGKVPAHVSIEPFEGPVEYRWGELLALPGNVEDYGEGGLSDVTIEWTKIAGPGDVQFTDSSDPATTASFEQFGTYTLRLTATDAGVNAEAYAEFDLELVSPKCQDVIDAGLLLVGDLNEDCHVNLEDFAVFAANWALCNDPTRPQECLWPFGE